MIEKQFYYEPQHASKFWLIWTSITFIHLVLVCFESVLYHDWNGFLLRTTEQQSIVLKITLLEYFVELMCQVITPKLSINCSSDYYSLIKVILSMMGVILVLYLNIGGGAICFLLLDCITFIVGETKGYTSKLYDIVYMIVRYYLYTIICFGILVQAYSSMHINIYYKIFAIIFTFWTPYAIYYNFT